MRYSKEEKAMRLKDWQLSGKSVWKYAKENSICPQTFFKWTKGGSGKKNELVEIPKSIMAISRQELEILIEKGDVKIHIPLEPVRVELNAVFEALGQAL